MQTPNTLKCNRGRHTVGAKFHREEGNNPDRQLSRVPKLRMHSNMRGRGAFCKPAKVDRKVCWRYQKCECWHE